jgi:hypothetical protein
MLYSEHVLTPRRLLSWSKCRLVHLTMNETSLIGQSLHYIFRTTVPLNYLCREPKFGPQDQEKWNVFIS